MTKIAYKTITNSQHPNLPNGFITDHFETEEDFVEGYSVVSKETFEQLMKNNVTLIRMHETNKGISGSDPYQPAHPQRPNHEAEPIDQNIVAARKKEIEEARKLSQQDRADSELFKQFLEWKRSQQGS